jgi:photosystem II oxygen-evolving enhancer protein 2
MKTKKMLKRVLAIALVVTTLIITGCTSLGAGLKSYVDSLDGYEFLYPNGWIPVKVADGPDVVFHDLIEPTENVSVVFSEVPGGKSLTELGSATEIGYQLSKNAIAPPDSGREAELVNAGTKTSKDKTYYLLEYAVSLPGDEHRHNLASVAVSRGKLFTFNVSTTEDRWEKVGDTLEQVVKSFTVY